MTLARFIAVLSIKSFKFSSIMNISLRKLLRNHFQERIFFSIEKFFRSQQEQFVDILLAFTK